MIILRNLNYIAIAVYVWHISYNVIGCLSFGLYKLFDHFGMKSAHGRFCNWRIGQILLSIYININVVWDQLNSDTELKLYMAKT